MRIREYFFEPESGRDGERPLHSRFNSCLIVLISITLLVAIAYSSVPHGGWTRTRAAVVSTILGMGLLARRRRLIYGCTFAVAACRFVVAVLFVQREYKLELAGGAILCFAIAWLLLKDYW